MTTCPAMRWLPRRRNVRSVGLGCAWLRARGAILLTRVVAWCVVAWRVVQSASSDFVWDPEQHGYRTIVNTLLQAVLMYRAATPPGQDPSPLVLSDQAEVEKLALLMQSVYAQDPEQCRMFWDGVPNKLPAPIAVVINVNLRNVKPGDFDAAAFTAVVAAALSVPQAQVMVQQVVEASDAESLAFGDGAAVLSVLFSVQAAHSDAVSVPPRVESFPAAIVCVGGGLTTLRACCQASMLTDAANRVFGTNPMRFGEEYSSRAGTDDVSVMLVSIGSPDSPMLPLLVAAKARCSNSGAERCASGHMPPTHACACVLAFP